jgi:hypothetical protein
VRGGSSSHRSSSRRRRTGGEGQGFEIIRLKGVPAVLPLFDLFLFALLRPRRKEQGGRREGQR